MGDQSNRFETALRISTKRGAIICYFSENQINKTKMFNNYFLALFCIIEALKARL